ncbi:hypothetical protein NLG97_g4665 [Lecanicillium saksenae]|uniref:Uncharacterized protein n=1 Tax=Lecanicillium saksenae TaxID=468837 RepID=A0ACC1QWH8_9HYPO|nr:hypothetical protein NLG97_g4665 [Lecanicillium saksenae]
MAQDTTVANGSKRSRDETDTLSPPNADLELKRRKFDDATSDGPSPRNRLGTIAAALSGVFGNNLLKTNSSQENIPPVEQETKPFDSGMASTQPQLPAAPAPLTASDKIEGPERNEVGPRRCQAIAARKAAASKPPPPRKPAAKPRGRKKAVPVPVPEAAPEASPATARRLENSADVPPPAANGTSHEPTASDSVSLPGPIDTPTKNRLFSPVAANSPKSILTPTKKRGPKPSKSVTFDGNGLFDHIPRSANARKPGRPKKLDEPDDGITCGICAKPHSKPPNEIVLCDNCDFAVHQECYELPEIPEGDWLCKSCTQEDILKTPKPEPGLSSALAPPTVDVPDIPNLDRHLGAMQRVLLDRCAGRRRIRMFGQDEASDKVRQLIEQTVLAGEGNSMLLIGPRGSGKSTLVENTITDLSQEHRQDFHVVRLNGFIHTDDKLALREIWRQLGKEMQVEDDLLNRSNYADTMASLLALLSHPSEILGQDEGVTSQAVVFIIDEFDMFATHPRQTLLYNLFDIAQSRKAPIAVLGCTTRMDVVEMLEKRVKSRFSHRYVYLSLAKTLPGYWQVCRQGLMLGEADGSKEGLDVNLKGYAEFQKYWNHKIEDLYKHRQFQDLLQYHYYTTKSASAFFSEWILPLSYLSIKDLTLRVPVTESEFTSLAPPDSRMQLLGSLSELDLSLLIAAARLDIVAHTDTVNFAMAYDEYSSLVGKQRVQSASSGLLAVGGNVRVWSRGVASTAWERLVGLGLLVPSGIGGGRTLGSGGLDGRMWKVDVSLEEIPAGVKLSAVMAKWCREI